MSQHETFPNAPITEAVLEIMVQQPSGQTDLKHLLGFREYLGDRFKETAEQRAFRGGFKLGGGGTAISGEEKTVGYLFKSSQEKKAIQVRIDGFSFSKLKPYDNWQNFKSEAITLWERYYEIVHPTKVSRISLRYINRIEIPYPLRDFSDYFLTNIQIAPGLPQSVSQLFVRFEIPNKDIPAIGIVIFTIEDTTDQSKLPCIFDIDVVRMNDYSSEGPEFWDDFERLRDFKNQIFFKSLTEKAKEIFR